ncbi:uncharacterized protein BP01DRAFT_381001 [Aspergillus saccharolyticus JOP 1030-1]|uniref:Uncharacterized protein n=1 Tax=Aspergillus saccharolyticus JOP 1030-1 TaxID=1450539 RepID=A0A319A4U1_9EURO|nr:hypothetical protein BP01DRAFT_381001 [Aspergillus saccharolyticus JOP 1030-1]PYH47158.1 hypothetical protein BP01DRAFT_381001 [Aspergillus saccharolyticus JOP 1030-1]
MFCSFAFSSLIKSCSVVGNAGFMSRHHGSPRVIERVVESFLVDGSGDFGGTSDWAVDLNETYVSNGTGSKLSSGLEVDLTVCDYSMTFASLTDLSAQAGSLRTVCIGAYTLQVLIDMLDTACTNYTNVNNDYDEMFGYYVTYIIKLIASTLSNEFMFNQSATTQWEKMPVLGTGMNYFDCNPGDGTDIPCIKLNTSYTYKEAIAEKTTALTLTNSDGYKAALANFGLEADWVTLGDYEKDLDFVAPHASKKFEYKFTGFPIQNDTMVVPNPKDIVTKGLGSIPDLKTSMQATLLDIMMGVWTNGTSSDAALAYSILVFLLVQAVDEMAQAKALGIYDTVDDPSSAVVSIIGMLLGVDAIAKVSCDGQGIASVAKLRRAMTSDEVAAMGSIFKANDDKLQAIIKVCKSQDRHFDTHTHTPFETVHRLSSFLDGRV